MNQTTSDLIEFVLHLGDSALIQGQRLCEWCGRAPALEEELALMNVGLDLIGQSRNWMEYAAELINDGRDADHLAFRRDERAFRNLLLVEQPNGDYAVTMTKQFLYDAWHFHILTGLLQSSDERIKGIAAKALKEVTYHLRRSGEWVERLGDGTEESHQRMRQAIDSLWRFTVEIEHADSSWQRLFARGTAPNPEEVIIYWQEQANAAAAAIQDIRAHLQLSQQQPTQRAESQQHMQAAIANLCRSTATFNAPDADWQRLFVPGIVPDPLVVAAAWRKQVSSCFAAATLPMPAAAQPFYLNGRQGVHTEHLGLLLAEMQFLQRAYPDAVW